MIEYTYVCNYVYILMLMVYSEPERFAKLKALLRAPSGNKTGCVKDFPFMVTVSIYICI